MPLEGTTSGEWWLINGQAMYADGDVGDLNHEGYVFDSLYGEFREAVVASERLAGLQDALPEESDPCGFRGIVNDWSDGEFKRGRFSEEEYDDPWPLILREIEWDRTKLDLLIDEGSDGRLWAMRELGWIRLAGRTVTMWTATAHDLKNLADGIWDAYSETGLQAEYDIEVSSRDEFFRGVPYEKIAMANPLKLREFLAYRKGVWF